MTTTSSFAQVEQIRRFLTRLATVIALLITLVPPVAYLANVWEDVAADLKHHSQLQAILVGRFVARHPEIWRDSRERLMEGLIGFGTAAQRTVVIDDSGQPIGETGPGSLTSPVIAREAVFFEFGVAAGVVRVETSMADNLKMANLIFLLSGLLGMLVFAPMRRIPLAALTDSVHRLARSEDRFRRLTELSADWYWEQDTTHRFVALSDGADRAGLDVRAALGKTRWEIGAGISDEAWAEHRCTLDARVPFRDFECTVRRADGEEVWISSSGEPTYDAQGKFAGYHGTTRDQTMRHQTENILRHEKALLDERVVQRTAELRAKLDSAQQRLNELEQVARDRSEHHRTV